MAQQDAGCRPLTSPTHPSRGQPVLSYSCGFPSQRCCCLQKPWASAPAPLRQVRLQVATRSGRAWGRKIVLGVEVQREDCVGSKQRVWQYTHVCNCERTFWAGVDTLPYLFLTLPTLEPHFVHALEHGDHVYFFFREVSVEDARLGRVRRWAPGVGSYRVLLGPKKPV